MQEKKIVNVTNPNPDWFKKLLKNILASK